MIERPVRVFEAADAAEYAHDVVHHDPKTPRAHLLVPVDDAAAVAGITALSLELRSLPPTIRDALANAESSAGQISADRLQGLAELIQNADDVGAKHAEIIVDEDRSCLMFRHDGAALTLHDVWALAIPWLSLKVDDADLLGRFGIGLKTLHALSETLDVHQGHFRVRYQEADLAPIAEPLSEPDGTTVFVIPCEPGVISVDAVAAWLSQWSDAGLVFLAHLSTVTLRSTAGEEKARLHVQRSKAERLEASGGSMRRRVATATDSRQWAVYSRSVPAPQVGSRSRKARSKLTPLAIAFPLSGQDVGHLHVGLPVRKIGLPFRVLAQFNPLTSRRDISDDPWNHSLIPMISALWLDAILDCFTRDPSAAWAAVPLVSELEEDLLTTAPLRETLTECLLGDARRLLAALMTLPEGESDYRLGQLAYEAPELEGILPAADIEALAGSPATITSAVRSADGRWRIVLDELRDLGADVPVLILVEDAMVLLDQPSRPVSFVADLVALAVRVGATKALSRRACLVLESGDRITPEDAHGLRALAPEGSGALWATLGLGRHLHPEFSERPGWDETKQWLHSARILLEDPTDRGALRELARAGERGDTLAETFTDEQANALRIAFEQLDLSERQTLGVGVGRAVRFLALRYDADGNRVRTVARPCDAYIIEREASTWRVAAGRTESLVWLHSRYGDTLRAESGREGVGAQRFFGYLGASRAPRLMGYPIPFRRFQDQEPGVPRDAPGSPRRRTAQMVERGATYSLGELISPDLDAVLSSIAREKQADLRIRRATAVLHTLSRAWDRLEQALKVRVADDYYSWRPKGEVDAWWVARAASIPWLTSAAGTATSPDQLRIRTAVTEAFFGEDSSQYLHDAFDPSTVREVLAALGVGGDPQPQQLLGRLRDLRDDESVEGDAAADLAAPLYRALSSQIARDGGRRSASISLAELRAVFGEGQGLVASSVGWRRPTVVLKGPPVFGDMFPFVPAVEGCDALWTALNVPTPGVSTAKKVLKTLSRRAALTTEQSLVMLNALRILAAALPEQCGNMSRASVWVGDRWTHERPVYAVTNPLIADGLSGQVPIWSPGGSPAHLDPLISRYNLTRIDNSHATVARPDSAQYQPELTEVYQDAVRNLQADLALSDPRSEAGIRLSWDDLATFAVYLLHGLTISLVNPAVGRTLQFQTRAWVDPAASSLYLSDLDAIDTSASAAYAVATAFAGDPRTIAHAWLAAWTAAREGHRAEAIRTAASMEAEQKRARAQREAEADARLRQMSERADARRRRSSSADAESVDRSPARPAERTAQPSRTLVDPSTLVLKNSAGEILEPRPARDSESSETITKQLREPNRKPQNATRPTVVGAGPRNYTQEEQETLGADLCRRLLGLDIEELVDIRNQHHVGADGVDQLDNFYEYKVHARAIPDVIRLEPSEIERARTTKNFFLIVIGNLEAGAGEPEIRIITNPLDQLVMKPTASVQFAGVLSAKALRYTFAVERTD